MQKRQLDRNVFKLYANDFMLTRLLRYWNVVKLDDRKAPCERANTTEMS